MKKISRPALAGFTLIEMAISIALLGLGLTTLIGLQTRLSKSVLHEKSLTEAALYAQYIMALIESRPDKVQPGRSHGSLATRLADDGYFDDIPFSSAQRERLKNWSYALAIEKQELAGQELVQHLFLYRIVLAVRWGTTPSEEYLLTYYARPPQTKVQ